jgi:hypothetical protein
MPEAVLRDITIAALMFAFVVWGVRGRWSPRGFVRRGEPGHTYEGWRRHVLRGIGLWILASVLIDLWYRLTGRGQFLH